MRAPKGALWLWPHYLIWMVMWLDDTVRGRLVEADMDGSGLVKGAAMGSVAGPWGSLIGAGMGLVGDLVGLNQQRHLQRETWRREDSAVQRRVADLRAAGLSPTLAAGSAAGSSAPINVMGQYSQAGERASEAIRGGYELRALKTGLRKLDAEAGRTEADRSRAQAEARMAWDRVPYARRLAESEDVTRFWQRGSARERAWIDGETRNIMEKTGMSEAKARVEAQERANRIAAREEEMGGGTAAGLKNWLPLIQALLDAIGR